MNNIFAPQAKLTIYKNRLYETTLTVEPTQIAQPLFAFAGAMATGEFVVGAMCGNHICLRAPGYSHVDTGIVALGRPYIRNGKILYVDGSGLLKIADIDYTALVSGSGTVIANIQDADGTNQHDEAMCYLDANNDWHILEYDNGGLRVKSKTLGVSPLRLYPKKRKNFLWQFNAAIVSSGNCLSSFYTSPKDGVVLYRHCKVWEHQRIAQDADLSQMDVDGAFDIDGNAFVFGRYRRTDEYDDGTVDWVVLPVIDDVIAMPAFAYITMSTEDDWPFSVATTDTQLIVSDFNRTGTIQLPEYIKRTVGDEIPVGDVSGFTIQQDGNAEIRLATWQKEYDIKMGDAILLEYSNDNGATFNSVELIADDEPALTYRGQTKELSLRCAHRGTWLITRSRLPNYIEIRGADTVVDVSPGKRETLYPAPKGKKSYWLYTYTIDTWKNHAPYSYGDIIGITDTIEHDGSSKNPLKFHNGPTGTKYGVKFTCEPINVGPTGRVLIYGWSRADIATDDTPVFTVKAVVTDNGHKQTVTLGEANFPKSWNGTSSGDYPIIFSLPPNVTLSEIILISTSRGDGVTVLANIYIDGGGNKMTVYLDDNSVCSWKSVSDFTGLKALQTNAANKECGLFSTTPYSISTSVDIAAALSVSFGKYPNDSGDTKYGIMLFAEDMQNHIRVVVDRASSELRLERVYRGASTIVFTAPSNPFQSIANMRVVYEGGRIAVYDAGFGLKRSPGDLVFEYEWKYTDGDIQPGDESHVGIYGFVRTPAIQALAWKESDEILVANTSADQLPSSGAIEFSGGRVYKYNSVTGDGPPDGPWQLRNTYYWISRYTHHGHTGWAVEVQKLDWDGPESLYDGKDLYTDVGYKWHIRNTDEDPFITTGGIEVDLHNRIRFYSDDISGSEPVSCDMGVFIGGIVLHGEFDDEYGYIAPPEIGIMKTTEKVRVKTFVARELGSLMLYDMLQRIFSYGGAKTSVAGNKSGSAPLWL